MNAIRKEIENALQTIADEHGVVLKELNISWINTTGFEKQSFKVKDIKIEQADII